MLLVHLGTVAGIAGPLGMMKAHDLRDWAQRQQAGECHPFFSQNTNIVVDKMRQVHCDLVLRHPPRFVPEPEVANVRGAVRMSS